MSNVLLIGNGGREFAIGWKLSQSNLVKNIFVWPASQSITLIKKCVNVKVEKQNLLKWCETSSINCVVIGPEIYLASGLSDDFRNLNITCFGPSKLAARIETSKQWAKEFMERNCIPTAKWKAFDSAEKAKQFIINNSSDDSHMYVVKASCLAAGKGVIVANSIETACIAVDELFENIIHTADDKSIIVEELLYGDEVSILGFSDGETIKLMLPVQDHKRIFENDQGPNTGGMGVYCPSYILSDFDKQYIEENIMKKAVQGLKNENSPFIGVLYAGLMLTKNGPKVLEFNCRFGDPETEVLLPLLKSDFYEIIQACCTNSLSNYNIEWYLDKFAVGIIMASKGYPKTSSKGQIIYGINDFKINTNESDIYLFHCGTALDQSNNWLTNGGRVLCVVGLDTKLLQASIKATKACEQIQFQGSQFRKDIASKAIVRSILNSGSMTYKKSGVNINLANDFVNIIKNKVNSTYNAGVLSDIGGFGALYDLKPFNYKDPILVSGTDGVGSKLKIAQICNNYKTIGIDLVAMCVNDIIAQGAEPLYFLDYYACGSLNINQGSDILKGIISGCKQANCSLIGGETAEMPGVYKNSDFDLAGFATGVVERDQILPKYNRIVSGDLVIGLPSNGLHSNGFSLVRKIIEKSRINLDAIAPFSEKRESFGDEFLKPTKIYVKSILNLMKSGLIQAFAHITGGGLLENIPRILPKDKKVLLNASKWNIPLIFGWLATIGELNSTEMLRTFNCGLGAILIISKNDQNVVLKSLEHYNAIVIGSLKDNKDDNQVEIINFHECLSNIMKQFIPSLKEIIGLKKRIAVLISGTGTNLNSLIKACNDPIMNIGGEIVLVISSNNSAKGLEIAKIANIRTKVITLKNYSNRQLFDNAIHEELLKWNVDLICLAGFMILLSKEFVSYWKGKLINIHPSLLPSFKGLQAQKQALDAGVKISGCTVHFVDYEVDSGQIIVQKAVQVESNDTVETLTNRIKMAEHECYPKALKILLNGDKF